MHNQILSQLRQLKLGGMAGALQPQLEQPGTYDGLSFAERLGLLLEQESLGREQRKQERLVRQVRFKLAKLAAMVQDIDYAHPRNVPQSQIAQLAQLELLLINDWGLEVLTAPQRNDLFEIMDDLYGSSAT